MTQQRARLSWALFDWAQQPYFTLIGSFIFRPYFVAAVAVTPAIGQTQIGIAGGIAGLIVAIAAPLLGILLDRGSLKAWLVWTSLPFVIACVGLWWALPGDAGSIPFILLCLIVAGAFAELTTTVNNAMLPPIAEPSSLGRLSSYGVALGCLGGIVSAALVIVLVLQPDLPLFGLDKAAHEPERFVGPFSALWYVLFLVPLFLFYPRDVRAEQPAQPLRQLLQMVRALPANRPMLWFLVGRMLAADAIGAVQIFGGIIAATTFGWGPAELGIFGILILASGGAGALLGGRLDDRISAKASVQLACTALAIALVGIGSVSPDHIFFVIPVAPGADDAGFLATAPEQVFFGSAALLGVASGPLVGSMRTWMAQLSPPGEAGQWFGLYGVAGRATAFAAPLLVALGTSISGNVGAAVPIVLLFVLGGMLAFLQVPATSGRS